MAAAVAEPSILAVAYVGIDNSPAYFRSFLNVEAAPMVAVGGEGPSTEAEADKPDLKQLVLGAQEQLEDHIRNAVQAMQRGDGRSTDPFLGVLTPTLVDGKDCSVYGYISACNMKVLVLALDHGVSNSKDLQTPILRSLLRQLHQFYVDAFCNPFFVSLDTPSFRAKVDTAVDRHNAKLAQFLLAAAAAAA
uniref:Trafficking protein particle complex subunit n=1 Tax=Alexandrium monilatum TaxID=311494 RepID=A0A7S4R3J2_9DINO